MKWPFIFLCFFMSTAFFAQSANDEVKNTVNEFFRAFHEQDSVEIRKLVDTNIILQTIGTGKDGVQYIRTENFDDLIRSITSIPDSVKFEERLLDYSIQVDGAMANAWTPYEFWINHEFHHCGVNSFQLFKEVDKWKIIYLIDTRRREGCQQ